MDDLSSSTINKRFHFTQPDHWIGKLAYEYKEIIETKPGQTLKRVYGVMNFVICAWHMHDWIWDASSEAQRVEWARVLETPCRSAMDFGVALKSKDRIFAICAQVANELKHAAPHRRFDDPNIRTEVETQHRVNESGSQVEDWMPVFFDGATRITDVQMMDQLIYGWIVVLHYVDMIDPELAQRAFDRVLLTVADEVL